MRRTKIMGNVCLACRMLIPCGDTQREQGCAFRRPGGCREGSSVTFSHKLTLSRGWLRQTAFVVVERPQQVLERVMRNRRTLRQPRVHPVAKMDTTVDARDGFLVRGSAEPGVRPAHADRAVDGERVAI